MTHKEFIKILDSSGYTRYAIEDDKISVDGGHIVLRIPEIPENVEFINGGNVDLSKIVEIPKNVSFKNGGSLYLQDVKSFVPSTEFKNGTDLYMGTIEDIPAGTTFENAGDVFLFAVKSIKPGVVFKNRWNIVIDNGNIRLHRFLIPRINSKRVLNVMIKQGILE